MITLRILLWLLISAGHYRGTVFQSCDAKVSSLRKRRYAKARIPAFNVYMESLSRFILTGSTVKWRTRPDGVDGRTFLGSKFVVLKFKITIVRVVAVLYRVLSRKI